MQTESERIRKAKTAADAVVAAAAEAEAAAKTANEGDEGVLSEGEGGGVDMPDAGDIEVEKDSALAKLLAAAGAAGLATQAVRAGPGAQVSKLASQQWAVVTSKRARAAAKSASSK